MGGGVSKQDLAAANADREQLKSLLEAALKKQQDAEIKLQGEKQRADSASASREEALRQQQEAAAEIAAERKYRAAAQEELRGALADTAAETTRVAEEAPRAASERAAAETRSAASLKIAEAASEGRLEAEVAQLRQALDAKERVAAHAHAEAAKQYTHVMKQLREDGVLKARMAVERIHEAEAGASTEHIKLKVLRRRLHKEKQVTARAEQAVKAVESQRALLRDELTRTEDDFTQRLVEAKAKSARDAAALAALARELQAAEDRFAQAVEEGAAEQESLVAKNAAVLAVLQQSNEIERSQERAQARAQRIIAVVSASTKAGQVAAAAATERSYRALRGLLTERDSATTSLVAQHDKTLKALHAANGSERTRTRAERVVAVVSAATKAGQVAAAAAEKKLTADYSALVATIQAEHAMAVAAMHAEAETVLRRAVRAAEDAGLREIALQATAEAEVRKAEGASTAAIFEAKLENAAAAAAVERDRAKLANDNELSAARAEAQAARNAADEANLAAATEAAALTAAAIRAEEAAAATEEAARYAEALRGELAAAVRMRGQLEEQLKANEAKIEATTKEAAARVETAEFKNQEAKEDYTTRLMENERKNTELREEMEAVVKRAEQNADTAKKDLEAQLRKAEQKTVEIARLHEQVEAKARSTHDEYEARLKQAEEDVKTVKGVYETSLHRAEEKAQSPKAEFKAQLKHVEEKTENKFEAKDGELEARLKQVKLDAERALLSKRAQIVSANPMGLPSASQKLSPLRLKSSNTKVGARSPGAGQRPLSSEEVTWKSLEEAAWQQELTNLDIDDDELVRDTQQSQTPAPHGAGSENDEGELGSNSPLRLPMNKEFGLKQLVRPTASRNNAPTRNTELRAPESDNDSVAAPERTHQSQTRREIHDTERKSPSGRARSAGCLRDDKKITSKVSSLLASSAGRDKSVEHRRKADDGEDMFCETNERPISASSSAELKGPFQAAHPRAAGMLDGRTANTWAGSFERPSSATSRDSMEWSRSDDRLLMDTSQASAAERPQSGRIARAARDDKASVDFKEEADVDYAKPIRDEVYLPGGCASIVVELANDQIAAARRELSRLVKAESKAVVSCGGSSAGENDQSRESQRGRSRTERMSREVVAPTTAPSQELCTALVASEDRSIDTQNYFKYEFPRASAGRPQSANPRLSPSIEQSFPGRTPPPKRPCSAVSTRSLFTRSMSPERFESMEGPLSAPCPGSVERPVTDSSRAESKERPLSAPRAVSDERPLTATSRAESMERPSSASRAGSLEQPVTDISRAESKERPSSASRAKLVEQPVIDSSRAESLERPLSASRAGSVELPATDISRAESKEGPSSTPRAGLVEQPAADIFQAKSMELPLSTSRPGSVEIPSGIEPSRGGWKSPQARPKSAVSPGTSPEFAEVAVGERRLRRAASASAAGRSAGGISTDADAFSPLRPRRTKPPNPMLGRIRDYSVLVDASSSMRAIDGHVMGQANRRQDRWDQAREALEMLVPQVVERDEDGISLYFFSTGYQKFTHVNRAQMVTDKFVSTRPKGGTQLAEALKDAVIPDNRGRPETILIITDGAPENRRAVEQVLVDASDATKYDDDLRVVFVQVGTDAQASEWLNTLDARLGCPAGMVNATTAAELKDSSLTVAQWVAQVVVAEKNKDKDV